MKLKKIFAAVVSACLIASTSVIAYADWYRTDDGYAYMYANGDIAETGWLHIGRHTYYINSKGVMQTGWIESTSGSWYYMNKDGRMLKNVWAQGKNGAIYFFDSNGKMYSNQWLDTSNGKRYYFGTNGKLYRGRWIHTASDSWYYALNSGEIITDKIAYFDGVPYLFDYNGKLVAIGTSQIKAYRKQQAALNNAQNDNQNNNQSMVYIKMDGDYATKYHLIENCSGATDRVMKEFAIQHGYATACEKCAGGSSTNNSDVNNDQSSTSQDQTMVYINMSDTNSIRYHNSENCSGAANKVTKEFAAQHGFTIACDICAGGPVGVRDETPVYINIVKRDGYYHFKAYCGDAGNRVALSDAKNQNFTKPCPNCVGDVIDESSSQGTHDHDHDHDHSQDNADQNNQNNTDQNNQDNTDQNGQNGQSGGINIADPNANRPQNVYATPAGRVYHYDANCDGGEYYPTTWENIDMRKLIPCDKCVRHR